MTLLNRKNKLERESSSVLTFSKLRDKFERQRPDYPWQRDVERVEKELFEIDRYKGFVDYMLRNYSFRIYDLSHGPFIHGRRAGILANLFIKKQKMTYLEPYKESVAVAGWMHDLGKLGLRGLKDEWDLHEQRSAEIAKETLPSLGYKPNEIDDISFIIRHHIFSVKDTYEKLLKRMLKRTDDMNKIDAARVVHSADRSEKLWREEGAIASTSVFLTFMLGENSSSSYSIGSSLLGSYMDIHFDRVEKAENVIPPHFSFVKK